MTGFDARGADAPLRRRFEASLRMPPLECGCRDPEWPRHFAHDRPLPSPESFGLDRDQLRREANRLHRAGWPVAEIRERLAVGGP